MDWIRSNIVFKDTKIGLNSSGTLYFVRVEFKFTGRKLNSNPCWQHSIRNRAKKVPKSERKQIKLCFRFAGGGRCLAEIYAWVPLKIQSKLYLKNKEIHFHPIFMERMACVGFHKKTCKKGTKIGKKANRTLLHVCIVGEDVLWRFMLEFHSKSSQNCTTKIKNTFRPYMYIRSVAQKYARIFWQS